MATDIGWYAHTVIQYDGTNSAAIIAADHAPSPITLYSEGGGVLMLQSGTEDLQFTLNIGDWAFYVGRGVAAAFSVPLLAGDYNKFDYWLSDINAAIAAGSVRQPSFGSANVPGILIGANANVAVTVAPTQANTGYTAVAFLVGATGNLSINSVTKTSGSVVTVQVHAAVAYVAGAQVVVFTY